MVLPAPVLPMIAVVWPATRLERDVAQHRVVGARVPELDLAELERAAAVELGDRVRGGTTDDSELSTSAMRSALTDARGVIIATNVASITDIRINMR